VLPERVRERGRCGEKREREKPANVRNARPNSVDTVVLCGWPDSRKADLVILCFNIFYAIF
jgi:hypothetical protein